MAKIKMTAIVAQISGKLAGTVFSKNRFGNYIRTLTSLRNPNSPAQQRVRALFGGLVSSWFNLSDDLKTAWNNAGNTALKVGSLGTDFSYSGRNLFFQLNRNLQEIGEAVLTSPPNPASVEVFNSFSVDIDETVGSEEIKASFDPAIGANTKVIIYATPILKKGQTFVSNNKFRKIAVLDNTFLTGSSIMADYLDVFKTKPAVGDRVAFKFRAIDLASGNPEYPLSYTATGAV